MSGPDLYKGVHGCVCLHAHVTCKGHTYSTHSRAHTQSSRRDGREGKDGVLGDAVTNVISNCGETEKCRGLWLIAFARCH